MNSALSVSGQKSPKNCAVTLRLRGSTSTQGLNSVATPSGHSSTSSAPIQNTRPSQAGSRVGARKTEVLMRSTAVHRHRLRCHNLNR